MNKEKRHVDMNLREEIHQQVQAALQTVPELIHEIKTDHKEFVEKQELIHSEFKDMFTGIKLDLLDLKIGLDNTTKQTTLTNGRVKFLERIAWTLGGAISVLSILEGTKIFTLFKGIM